jgi:hypothetical protein
MLLMPSLLLRGQLEQQLLHQLPALCYLLLLQPFYWVMELLELVHQLAMVGYCLRDESDFQVVIRNKKVYGFIYFNT